MRHPLRRALVAVPTALALYVALEMYGVLAWYAIPQRISTLPPTDAIGLMTGEPL